MKLKCELFQRKVSFLGHTISAERLTVKSDKINKIVDWSMPQNVAHIQSFVETCSYYRKFVKHFAKISSPFTELLRRIRSGSGRTNSRRRLNNWKKHYRQIQCWWRQITASRSTFHRMPVQAVSAAYPGKLINLVNLNKLVSGHIFSKEEGVSRLNSTITWTHVIKYSVVYITKLCIIYYYFLYYYFDTVLIEISLCRVFLFQFYQSIWLCNFRPFRCHLR